MSTKLDANQVIKAIFDADNNALRITGNAVPVINQDLIPDVDDTYDLGDATHKYNEIFVNQIKDASDASGDADQVLTAVGDGTFSWEDINSVSTGLTTPSGATADGIDTGTANATVMTADNAVNDASVTKNIYIESGDKTTGSGVTGNINTMPLFSLLHLLWFKYPRSTCSLLTHTQ